LNFPDNGNDLWLVVHVPKTAGTSLRLALEKHFGKHRLVRDYGPDAEQTNQLVLDHMYNSTGTSGGREALIEAMKNGPGKILIGHFPLKKYAESFKPEKIIAFVRDPLIRACSEYLHRVKSGMFEGSLVQFFQAPSYQNQQAKLLRGISNHSFIGITERYNLSLTRINTAYCWKIPVLKRNVGRKGGGRKLAEGLSTRELDLFYRLNQRDMELYEASRQRFDAVETPGRKTRLHELLSWE
jgi:hypothetical protein